MILLPLSQFGLLTLDEAAALRGVDPRTVRRWIASDLLPAVAVTGPGRVVYLVRAADVRRAKPERPGRKKGAK